MVLQIKCSCGCDHRLEADKLKDIMTRKCFICGETVTFKNIKENDSLAESLDSNPVVSGTKRTRKKSA